MSRRFLLALLLASMAAGLWAQRKSGPAPSDFHFAIIGDRAGSPEPGVYERAWYEINLFSPAFVINVGDTIRGGGDDSKIDEQWLEAKAILDPFRHIPFYYIPGNHDIWSEASRRAYIRESGRPCHYSFNHGPLHVTVLDNSQAGDGALPDAELQFLERDLAAHKAQPLKLVVFHKPFWIEPVAQGRTDFPLHRLARKYGVTHIVSGHGHRFVHMVHDGVDYMEVGSSGGTMRGKLVRGEGFAQGCFYHYVLAHVRNGRLDFVVKELPPPHGQARFFPASDWDAKGPRFDPAVPATPAR